MNRLRLLTLCLASWSILSVVAQADVIQPVGILATSEFDINIFASQLIDGSGLVDEAATPDDVLDDLHDNAQNWETGWHSGDSDAGIPGGTDDDGELFTTGPVDEQILEFDLGNLYNVSAAHIWQQNQSGLGGFLAPDRGVEIFELLVSTTPTGDTFELFEAYELESELGSEPAPAQVIDLPSIAARRIRFNIVSAFSGNPNEFVGLGEVRFEGTLDDSARGDFDFNGVLDANDIDLLTAAVRAGDNDPAFDVDGDTDVDRDDRLIWVEQLRATCFGDANMDGEFSSTDLVVMFQAGEYEDELVGNSTWSTGDVNGDAEFDSSDFVSAFQAACYELGPREAVASVPEPNSLCLLLVGAMVTCLVARRP